MLFQPLARTTAMETVSPAFLTASTSMMNSTRISSPIPSEKAQASSKLSLIKVYINIISMFRWYNLYSNTFASYNIIYQLSGIFWSSMIVAGVLISNKGWLKHQSSLLRHFKTKNCVAPHQLTLCVLFNGILKFMKTKIGFPQWQNN